MRVMTQPPSSGRWPCRCSTMCTRSLAICLAAPPTPTMRCRNAYLRAFRHFDTYHGPAIKPWLFAILRNVCHAEFARRARSPTATDDLPDDPGQTPLWRETQETPEAQLLRRRDASTIRRLVIALDEPFRETFVLREIHNLSYREIADIVEAPVGTVMSRLARARAMLRSAWLAQEEQP